MRWWDLSAIFLSIFMIIYVIYCASVRIDLIIPFGELWVIPIIGIVVYLLLKNPKVKGMPQIDQD
jgi:O-antigen ligase